MAGRVNKGNGRVEPFPARKPGGDKAPDPQHNERAVEEAEAAQLLSYINILQQQIAKLDELKAAAKAQGDIVTATFRGAKASGFQRQELQQYLNDLKTTAKDLVDAEARRHRHRRMLGLPLFDQQPDLFGSTLSVDRERALVRAEGYLAGINGHDAKPADTLSPVDLQEWMAGYNDGQAILALRLKQAKEDEDRKPAPKPESEPAPAPAPKPKSEDEEDDHAPLP